MSTEAHSDPIFASASARWRKALARLRVRSLWRAFASVFSSSLTRRIVALNLGGLLVLVIAFLLLNQFRADIIDARTQSLKTQAGIIAAAIAASAAVETDTITIDPEKLLQLAPSENATPAPSEEDSIEFSDEAPAAPPQRGQFVESVSASGLFLPSLAAELSELLTGSDGLRS